MEDNFDLSKFYRNVMKCKESALEAACVYPVFPIGGGVVDGARFYGTARHMGRHITLREHRSSHPGGGGTLSFRARPVSVWKALLLGTYASLDASEKRLQM